MLQNHYSFSPSLRNVIPFFLLWCMVGGLGQGCTPSQTRQAENGVLDLRGEPPFQTREVALKGDWAFYWEEFLDGEAPGTRPPTHFMPVPGTWRGRALDGRQLPGSGYASYHLRVLLPDTLTGIGLRIPEFTSAYELEINGSLVCGNGRIGKDAAHTKGHFEPHIVHLPDSSGQIDLLLRGANFDFFRGGMLQVLIMDRYARLKTGEARETLFSGVLCGIMLLAGLFHLIVFAYRPGDRYNLSFAIFCLFFGVHTLWVNMRFMYVLLGPEWWAFNLKMEGLAAAISLVAVLLFFYDFYPRLIHKRYYQVFSAGLISLILGFLVLPPYFATAPVGFAMYLGMPFILFVLFIAIRAWREQREGAIFFFLAWLSMCVLGIFDFFSFSGFQVGEGLLLSHFGLVGFTISVSILIARRAARSFSRVRDLSAELQQKNVSLEAEVRKRTEAFLISEKKNHALELEKKRRDLERLSASNHLVQKHNENLVRDLQKILKEKGNYAQEIRALILRLREQTNTSEKILQLQDQLATLSDAFFDRLQQAYPNLTKSERELCAYIKLGLSSKDIATLRNTTPNTINVTRHRLRKKLQLERGVELESFIRQI